MSAREGRGKTTKEQPHHTDPSPLNRLQARGEQLLDSLSTLRKSFLPEGEQNLEGLLGQIDKVRDSVSRRAQATGRDLESRAEQALGELEQEVVRRLGPVLARANLLSRADVAPLESRIAYLEGRLGTLLDDRATLTSRVVELESNLEDARAVATEREREATIALSTGDGLQQSLTDMRDHLDALSKDHMSRTLESGKLEDRLMRLEVRLGELLKEQSTRATDKESLHTRLARVDETIATCETRLGDLQQAQSGDGRVEHATDARLADVARTLSTHAARLDTVQQEHSARASEKDEIQTRLARVNQTLEESARTLESAAKEATAAIAATHELGTHLETLRDERTADRSELFQLTHRLGEVERTLRQCDLRLGDLAERHTAGREELASLAARISQLELTAARPTPTPGLRGQAEGH